MTNAKSKAHRASRLLALSGTSLLIVGLTLVGVATVSPAGEGNPQCADLGFESGFKFEPIKEGEHVYTSGDFSVTMNVYDEGSTPTLGQVADWSGASAPVDGVIAKGSSDYLLYTYSGATSGNGVHAPVAGKSGKYADLSHVTFCFAGETDPTVPDPTTPDPTTPDPTTPDPTTPDPTTPEIIDPTVPTSPPVTGVTLPPTTEAPATTEAPPTTEVPPTTAAPPTTETPVTGVTLPPAEDTPPPAGDEGAAVVGVTELAHTGDGTSSLALMGALLIGLGMVLVIGGARHRARLRLIP